MFQVNSDYRQWYSDPVKGSSKTPLGFRLASFHPLVHWAQNPACKYEQKLRRAVNVLKCQKTLFISWGSKGWSQDGHPGCWSLQLLAGQVPAVPASFSLHAEQQVPVPIAWNSFHFCPSGHGLWHYSSIHGWGAQCEGVCKCTVIGGLHKLGEGEH